MDGTSDSRLRAMRWNERIRLVIGVFNRSAVAVLGAAAVGSAFQQPGAAGGSAASPSPGSRSPPSAAPSSSTSSPTSSSG